MVFLRGIRVILGLDRPLLDLELQAYLPLRPTRGTEQLKRVDLSGKRRRRSLGVNQASQRKPNRSDEGFRQIRRIGMENLDAEDRFVDGSGERKSDPLVPHRFS